MPASDAADPTGPEDQEPLAEGLCNVLYASENARAAARIVWTAFVFGNWVGGRLRLYRDGLTFRMNRLNAAMQVDSGPLRLDAADVTGVSRGRMLLGLAATVDLDTVHGLARFRCGAALRRSLVEIASGWVAARGR